MTFDIQHTELTYTTLKRMIQEKWICTGDLDLTTDEIDFIYGRITDLVDDGETHGAFMLNRSEEKDFTYIVEYPYLKVEYECHKWLQADKITARIIFDENCFKSENAWYELENISLYKE